MRSVKVGLGSGSAKRRNQITGIPEYRNATEGKRWHGTDCSGVKPSNDFHERADFRIQGNNCSRGLGALALMAYHGLDLIDS